MQDIFKYIEGHNNDAIGELSDFCRLPSVSAQGTAIRETADYVVARLQAPETAGAYTLKWDLVQGDLLWFEEKGSTPLEVQVEVK